MKKLFTFLKRIGNVVEGHFKCICKLVYLIGQYLLSQLISEQSQPEKNGQITQAAQLVGTQEGTSGSISTHPTTRMDHPSKTRV